MPPPPATCHTACCIYPAQTIENQRVKDETMVQPDDVEVAAGALDGGSCCCGLDSPGHS